MSTRDHASLTNRRRVPWLALAAWLVLLALLVLGSQARRSETGRAFRRFLHARTLERSQFPSNAAVTLLTHLGRLHPVPPDPAEARPGKRALYGRYRLSVDPIPQEEVASTLAVEASALSSPLPVVSLLADDHRLAWLHQNRAGRGKDFEIPGFFSLIEDGEVRFSAKVDLRLHGGWTRRIPQVSSYRAYFRRGNGVKGFPAALLSGYSGPDPQRLIIRFNGAADPHGREWHFTGPLAYDIARQAGVPAPFTRPVLFYVNGENRGVRALTEHLSSRTFEQKLGHDRFVLVDSKPSFQKAPLAKHGDIRTFEAMSRELLATRPMTAERAGSVIDLDNFARWWVTVLFCATEDRFQGPVVLDLESAEPRWAWTAWDIDRSFGRGSPPGEPWWRLDSFDSAFHRRELRIELLRRLLEEDPAYPAQLARIFDEVMNHRLTDDFLSARTDHYARLVTAAKLPEAAGQRLREVATGAEQRQLRVRELLDHYWHLGPNFKVQVEPGDGQVYEVDGFRKSGPYRGFYFAGQTLRLSPPSRALVTLNGQPPTLPTETLELKVNQNLTIAW